MPHSDLTCTSFMGVTTDFLEVTPGDRDLDPLSLPEGNDSPEVEDDQIYTILLYIFNFN